MHNATSKSKVIDIFEAEQYQPTVAGHHSARGRRWSDISFDNQPNIALPRNKCVIVPSLLDEKLSELHAVPVDNQFFTTTL
jgi:hypothetical protein